MTQNGIVTKLLGEGLAQVAVTRTTACGGRCGGCEACVYDSRLLVEAENVICARPGERVELESETSRMVGAALLVYMLPILLFFAGYAAGALLGAAEGVCVILSLAGVVIGGALAVFFGRRRGKIRFRIVGYSR